MNARTGHIVNREQLAQMLGVSVTVVNNYVRAGCPFVQKGDRGVMWQFDTAEVFEWVRQQDKKGKRPTADPAKSDADEARRRNAEASAQLKEYELAALRGKTLLVEDVRPILMEELSTVRSRLMSIPGRLAVKLAAETDPEFVEKLIKNEIGEALRELTADQA